MSTPGSATAADVPGKYDVVINGYGYMFADSVESSIPFRSHRAIYDITPTFVERQNVSNAYGDQQQDFWLTVTQKDWSLGEEQRYLHTADQEGVRRYYKGTAVDISLPGKVAMLDDAENLTAAATPVAMEGDAYSGSIYFLTSSTAYSISSTGTISSLGAHGLSTGAGACLTPDAAGSGGLIAASFSTGIRKRTSGGVWSLLSATSTVSMVYANNTLYGFSGTTLYTFDSAGTATAQFTFKDQSGAGIGTGVQKLLYYGGKILLVRTAGYGNSGGEIWQWDGVGMSLLAALPANFSPSSSCITMGIVILAGSFRSAKGLKSALFYYANGNLNLLWQAEDFANVSYGDSAVAAFRTGFVFTDETKGLIRFYDLATGAISSLCAYTPAGGSMIATANRHLAWNNFSGSTIVHWPKTSTIATTSTVTTSLVDLDSALKKIFRGVTIDFDSATDGDGGSMDVAYALENTTSYTSLATGITSGTEVPFSGVSGHSISIKVTLNKGTSTYGPVLKRIYLRAAPQLQQFSSGTYILDCTGSPDAPRELRDGSYHPLTGFDQITHLRTSAKSTVPFSVTDKVNGTFTALVDLQDPEGWDVYEVHPNPDNLEKAGSYLVRVKLREV